MLDDLSDRIGDDLDIDVGVEVNQDITKPDGWFQPVGEIGGDHTGLGQQIALMGEPPLDDIGAGSHRHHRAISSRFIRRR
jgi:hypothetical protein